MFNIIDLDTEELVQEDGVFLTFVEGKEAAKFCTNYVGSRRLQPRKHVSDPNWRDREAKRFLTGEYVLPEFLQGWSASADHYLHLATDKSGLLAYTKDAQKGQADIQNKISFRAYNERFLGHSHSAVACIEMQIKDYFSDKDGLQFATTEEDITRVYTNYDIDNGQLAASCMRGVFATLPQHPTTVYAAGDLAIAYLQNEKEQTSARALVWPEKKIYGRIYGLPLLHDILKKKGYSKSAYYQKDGMSQAYQSFDGARLKKVDVGSGHFLMPFIDERTFATDMGDHFVIFRIGGPSGTRYVTGYQSGTTNEKYFGPIAHRCQECEEECGDRRTVVTPRGRQLWCQECVDDNTFHCHYYGGPASDDMAQITMHDGKVWSSMAYDQHGFMCERFKARYHSGHRHTVWVNDIYQFWCADAVVKHAKAENGKFIALSYCT